MKCKHHIKKQYKGVQIDLYQDMDTTWYALVPNRVHPMYRSARHKRSQDAVLDCQRAIDARADLRL